MRSSAAIDGAFKPRSPSEIYPRLSPLMLANRSSGSPLAARNLRRLTPTPAVRLMSSKARLLLDRLTRLVRIRRHAGAQAIAHSAESWAQDIVLRENICLR